MQKANAWGVRADDGLSSLRLPLNLGKPAGGFLQLTPKVRRTAVILRGQFLLQVLALLLQLLFLLQLVVVACVVPQTTTKSQKIRLTLIAMFISRTPSAIPPPLR